MSDRFDRRVLLALVLLSSITAATAQTYVERTGEVGIAHENAPGFDRIGTQAWLFDWAQSGVALGDIDGDDDLDLVATGGPWPLHVYRNDGRVFTDVTAASGVEIGHFARTPALGDIDNDGDLDLFLGTVAHGEGVIPGYSRLYLNDGTGTFTDITEVAGTLGAGHSIHAKFADLNRDGLIDLWTGEFHGTPNQFYRNNGDLSFTEMGVEMDLDTGGSTHVLAVADTNNDGQLDGFVASDYSATRQADLVNNVADAHISALPDGEMVDVSGGSGYDAEAGLMGLTVADVNYDGLLDIYKTDAGTNDLLINKGWPSTGLPWVDETAAYGIAVSTVPNPFGPPFSGVAISWGCAFHHADFDPWLDLFVANGMVAGAFADTNPHTRFQQDYFFRGQGPTLGFTFADETNAVGLFNQIDSRGIAIGDVDGDGDLDLFISTTTGPLRYYENQLDPAGLGWLMVRADTTTSNRDGVGTRVKWTDMLGFPHMFDIGSDGPTASQNPNVAHFGLGAETSCDVTATFPSGITRTVTGVSANTEIAISEPQLFSLSTRKLPIVSEQQPGDPTNVVVTVFAHDANGNPLTSAATVTIKLPGMNPSQPVTNVSGNQFQRTFVAPVTAGSFRVEATFDGFKPKIGPMVHAYGPLSITASTIRVLPEAVRARSDDTFTVRIAPKDANGITLGAGLAVAFGPVAGAAPLSGTTDLGNGIYAATYAAPQTPGIHAIDVTIDGTPYAAVATVDAAGTPAAFEIAGAGIPGGPLKAAGSTYYIEDPTPVNSAAPHQYKVLLTPRDLAGRRVGPRARLVVDVAQDPETAPVTVRLSAPHSNGDFPILLEKAPPPATLVASGTMTIRVDGRVVATIPYEY